MNIKKLFIWGLLLVIGPLVGYSQNTKTTEQTFYIVVNVSNELENIKSIDLVNIYLGKQTLWQNGSRVMPAMLKENKTSMRQFVEIVLRKTVPQYRAYWKRRLFSGGGTVPKTFKSSKKLVNYVARVPGAIGITDKKIANNQVKYLKITTSSVIKK